MLELVAQALQEQDYQNAARLLKQLQQEQPNNLQVRLYVGRYHEATGELETAEKVYRQLLQSSTNPKIVSPARQGLGRVQELFATQRQQAINQATTQSGGEALGVLILEPIPTAAKQTAAQNFAQIMQLDAYSARLQLPSRGWRLYRTGKIGELQYYVSALNQVQIPCFCTSIPQINQLSVYQVESLSFAASQLKVVCQNQQQEKQTFSFPISAINQRVEGLIPLFEQVMEMDVRRKFHHKTKVLDYAQFCDLHISREKIILRICDLALPATFSDRNYNFQPEKATLQSTTTPTTIREKWQQLTNLLQQNLSSAPLFSDFNIFAQTAIDFPQTIEKVVPHLDLSRKEKSLWDNAWQLYSGLTLLKNSNHYLSNE